MRFRIVSVPPLPPCQVWHLLPAYRLPAERNAAAGSLLPSPATKGSSLISTIAELKQDLCHGLPVLAEFPAKALRLTLDNFELLDNSPIDVIQENDLVCVELLSPKTIAKRRGGEIDKGVRGPFKAAEQVEGIVNGSDSSEEDSDNSTSSSSASSTTGNSSSSTSTSEESSSDSDSGSGLDDGDHGSSSTESSSVNEFAAIGRVDLASKRTVGAKLKNARSSQSNAAVAVKAPVPPGFGKATTHSRNARRKRKRQLERANSSEAGKILDIVGRESANAVPLGMRATALDAQYAGTASKSSQDLHSDFDVSRLDSTLHNKNKRRGFARSVEKCMPQRTVFEDGNDVRSVVVQRPRLVHPSERASRGQLPENIFVTSVEVEGNGDGWGRKQKKKRREDYGCAEDEVVEADISLNYGECDTDLTEQPVNTRGSFTAKDWREAEENWSSGAYKAATALGDLKAGDIVGFKAMDINPTTCTPELLLQLARIIRTDDVESEVHLHKIARPGMESIGFGSRAVGDRTFEDACLDEEDETTVTLAEVLAGGWYIIRSMHM